VSECGGHACFGEVDIDFGGGAELLPIGEFDSDLSLELEVDSEVDASEGAFAEEPIELVAILEQRGFGVLGCFTGIVEGGFAVVLRI
jgi:hypothetical protein